MIRSARRAPHGGAVIELAVCLPPLLLLLFGSVECCGMIFLQQSLVVCSYEGARSAIRFDATNAQVLQDCNDLLAARKVRGGTVTFSPGDVSAAKRGSRVTITVTAPCNSNAFLPYLFFNGRRLSGQCTMVKE